MVQTKCAQRVLWGNKWLLIGAIVLTGCGTEVYERMDEAETATDQPGSGFFSPRESLLSPVGSTAISGELRDAEQVETWDLGFVAAGTRLTIAVSGFGANFSLGLFDQDFQVRMVSHDRYNSKDPRAVFELQEDIDTLYLVVASDPFEDSVGPYVVQVDQSSEVQIKGREQQVVVLNFGGGENIAVGSVNIAKVRSFDAADLDPKWAGLTEEVKVAVMDSLLRIYEGLNVEFYFHDDPDVPEQDFSSIYFGAEDSNNVGLAATIDYGNRNKQHNAVVYTLNFAKYIPYGYSHVDLARGFANVAAHELGHLLGLNHSDLPADVMNVSPTVDALVAPQYFSQSARLASATFPVGRQDGALRILETVGGDWPRVTQARQESEALYAAAVPGAQFFSAKRLHLNDLAQLSSGQHCNCD